jgi:LysM repeat protein
VRALNAILLVGMLLVGGSAAPYVVRAGDTLAGIASRHHASVAALTKANNIKNPNVIRIGQTLQIPDPPAPASFHVVQVGETLALIAAANGTTVAAIAAANGITDPNRIAAGIRLRIVGIDTPAPPAPKAAGGARTHVVRPGDTLASIARRYGTTVAELARANGVKNPNVIRIGAQLQVGSGWRCPVAGPLRFTNDWGFPRHGGRFHQGTDLMAARGTPVVASVSGVAHQVTGSLGGLQVRLVGDDGFTYWATHLDWFGVAGRVAAGAVIGYVGTSGNAQGGPPHVHFEIHEPGGQAVNPFPTVQASCSG